MIPFNKPYLTGREIEYIKQAVKTGKISGNGIFSQKCQNFLEERYGFRKVLLTTSCTDALEMCAILAEIHSGDEVIMPSYTFVSTALAFVRQGAKIVFVDSREDNPCIDEDKIESLISNKTKAIIPVHYAGISCNMEKIMDLADKYNLLVIEDAAQAFDSYYLSRPLGSIGHLAVFSFHETKNIQSGEGGALLINDERFIKRSEIIWEKGTNRAEFYRGEVNKYGWIDIGSSFLPSEITAAFLWAQLEEINKIQSKRILLWNLYYQGLSKYASDNEIILPIVPDYATHNAHLFYLICKNLEQRISIIEKLRGKNILAISHFLSLHKSPYYHKLHDGRILSNSDIYSERLIRLPLYYELSPKEVKFIINCIVQ